MRDVPVLQFAKFLCPTLEYFDDEPLADVDPDFEEDPLIEQLAKGSEDSLREFLTDSIQPPIQWGEPQFMEFREETDEGFVELEERVRAIEDRIPQRRRENEDSAEISALRADVRELKEQVAQIARLLFVHDRALGHMWESSEHGNE
jgi:hypothetical protein